MTQSQSRTPAHVGENFSRILETCRAAHAARDAQGGVESLLKTLSPGQMLKIAASAGEELDSGAFVKALCAARLFESEHAVQAAPEYNAHLALPA
jgi:hypothetical protein